MITDIYDFQMNFKVPKKKSKVTRLSKVNSEEKIKKTPKILWEKVLDNNLPYR